MTEPDYYLIIRKKEETVKAPGRVKRKRFKSRLGRIFGRSREGRSPAASSAPSSKRSETQKTRGISFIEVLFALFIMSVVFFAVLFFYSTGQKHFINQSSKADSLFDSRFPLTRMTQDIKNAIQVLPGPISIEGDSLSTGTHCVILQVPSIDSDGLILDIDNRRDTIVYWQDGQDPNQLMRAVLVDPYSSRLEITRLIIDSLHSFDLEFYDADGNEVTLIADTASVDLRLSASFPGIGRDFQESFNTSVRLRNKSNE